MKLLSPTLTLAVSTLRMVEPGAVHPLVALNTLPIRGGLNDVNVARRAVSAPSPTSNAWPRSTGNRVNNNRLNRLTRVLPIRRISAPGEQDSKVNE